MIKMKVTGIDATIRSFNRKNKDVEQAITDGTEEAGDYLIECIENKFGVYQSGWKKLKYETIARKRRRGAGANADKPLIEFGDMMFSFYKRTRVRTRKHVIHILSDDPKILHHIYGAPSVNVPKRDPVRPTMKKEHNKCLKFIRDAVGRVL